jgi:hypothetical protein
MALLRRSTRHGNNGKLLINLTFNMPTVTTQIRVQALYASYEAEITVCESPAQTNSTVLMKHKEQTTVELKHTHQTRTPDERSWK